MGDAPRDMATTHRSRSRGVAGVTGRIAMKIRDVVSALSVVAGLPPTILLTCLVSVFALHGCAGFVTSESTPSAHGQPPVERPVTIRTLGSDQRFSQLSSATVAAR